ncbi:MAG: TIGR03621 family F420-dependent LLM class oxidoreductase [Ktedonobacteraceae bacterium]|nr:TIGR03621 family F420-dependent LLM class oxidoreductase [Ktedonobacteraceae bacterium]
MSTLKHHPFRFGVVAAHVQSRADWIAKARKVEDLGYDTLLVVDHLTASIGPLVALTLAAEVTSKIRVGSFVLCNDFRHPAILAKELATLDLLTEGRLEFGLGAGYLPTDYQKSGLALDRPGLRVSRFEEAIHVVKKLFTEETVNFKGAYYTISDLPGTPKPVQKPHPPFYIGGGGKRVLSFAAREADIVGIAHKNSAHGLDLSNTTTEPTTEKIAWVREAAGERFQHLELSVMIFRVVVTEHREGAAQQAGARFGLSAPQALSSVQLLFGTVEQIAEELWARRERFGISYIVINEEQMDAFAPVITRLSSL